MLTKQIIRVKKDSEILLLEYDWTKTIKKITHEKGYQSFSHHYPVDNIETDTVQRDLEI